MGVIASEMVPPATDRLFPMMHAVLVTFQMAVVGTVIGVVISIPGRDGRAKPIAPRRNLPWGQP